MKNAFSLSSLLMKSFTLLLPILAAHSVWSEAPLPRTIYTTSDLETARLPLISVNDQGDAAVVWVENQGRSLRYVLKTAEDWLTTETIVESFNQNWPDEIKPLTCDIDPNGNLKITWENFDEDLIIFCRHPNGNTITETRVVSEEDIGRSIICAKNPSNIQYRLSFEFDAESDFFTLSRQNPDKTWSKVDSVKVPNWYYSTSCTHLHIDSFENVYITIGEPNNNGFFSLYRAEGQWSEFEFIDRNDDIAFNSSTQYPHQKNFNSVLDSNGNLMVVWELKDGAKSVIYEAYKPFGHPWKDPQPLTSSHENNCNPILKTDEIGRFILVWTRNAGWCDQSIQARIFSSTFPEWSSAIQLSPLKGRYMATSFALSPKGQGAVAAISYEEPFDLSIKAIFTSFEQLTRSALSDVHDRATQ